MRSVLQVATIKATVSIRFSKMKIYKIKNLNMYNVFFFQRNDISNCFTRFHAIFGYLKNQKSDFMVFG